MVEKVELPIDRYAVDSAIRDVAATEIMPNFKQLNPSEISTKSGPRDFVTVVDVRAEKALSRSLGRLLPGAEIVGEESVHSDRSKMDLLSSTNPVWVIDPLDGTGNYIEGKPQFAVIVALLQGGFVRAGWIYDPINDEMVWAIKGHGAWRDGQQIRIPKMSDDLATTKGRMAPRFYRPKLKKHIEDQVGSFAEISSASCAGQDFLALLRGDAQFAAFRGNRPWDVAAGQFIYQEAGGYAAHIDSMPYRPGYGMGLPLLMAPEGLSWKKLRDMLFPLELAA